MNTEPLSVSINSNDVPIGERERHQIDAGVARLDAWTKRLPSRAVQLTLRHHPRDGVHTVNLVVELPNKTIVAHDSAPFLLAAIDRAFKKAARQVSEHKALIRRDHLHQKLREVRSALPSVPEAEVGEAARQRDLQEFRNRTSSYVGRLRAFLREEMSLLERRGVELTLTLDDLVDETLGEALERFEEKPWALPSANWLYSVAMDVLERHANGSRVPNVAVEFGSDVPEPPSADDDLYDGLHRLLFRGEVDDEGGGRTLLTEPQVLGISTSDPAEAAEEADLRARVAQLLAELPALWRRAFLLHFLEGFDYLEIAQMQGLTEDQVRFHIQSAELFLRGRLGEARNPG